jgi:AcrR family transcriptional regulator
VGSLYQYLPDRAAIIDALAARYFAQIEAVMDDLVRAAPAQRWADTVGVLVDAFAALYRTEHGFRALWFGSGMTERTRAADRAHKRRMADGVRRVLLALGLAHDDERLTRSCHAAILAADALAQEAFRRDPQGDTALLEEAKVMLRGYLTVIAGRRPTATDRSPLAAGKAQPGTSIRWVPTTESSRSASSEGEPGTAV